VAGGDRCGLWQGRRAPSSRHHPCRRARKAPAAPVFHTPRHHPRELLDQRLDDLHHQRTWLDVFPLLALERPFDMTAFWNHAIQVGGVWGSEGGGFV
jgi:hypothetical protein